MSRKIELWTLILIDAIAFTTAFYVYYFARFEWGMVDEPGVRPASILIPSILFSVYWFALFLFAGLYRERYASSRFDEIVSIGKVISFGILVLFFLIFIDQFDNEAGRKPVLYYWLSLFVCVVIGRMVVRTIQKKLVLKGYGTHKTLVVGWEEEVESFYEEVKKYPAAGFDVVGILKLPHQSNGKTSEGKALIFQGETSELQSGVTVDKLPGLIDKLNVQDVLITLGTSEPNALMEVLQRCDGKSVTLKIVPDFYSVIGGMTRTEHIYGLPIIEVFPEPMSAWEQSTKRLIDLMVSLLILLVTLPLQFVVALIIKISSKGKIIYKQKRVGQFGKPFTMYKFRTMHENAEASTGPVWATENDPRYTSFGRWLRKTRLDELPQLFNVLRGSMSLVGPRPERPFFVEKLSQEIPLYYRRHRVKPGITGLAQVKWKYDESLEDVRQKVKYDLFYIENMSLQYDFNILLQTIRIALLGKGQ